MNKPDVVNKLYERGYTKKDAAEIVKDFTEIIMEAMAGGEEVQFVGFGTFRPIEVSERRMRNVITHEMVTVPAHRVPRFVPSKLMRDAVKNGYVITDR